MNARKLVIAACCAYALMVIFTFGNAAVYFEKRGIQRVAECLAVTDKEHESLCSWYESTGFAAVFASAAWPFYWSYRMAQ